MSLFSQIPIPIDPMDSTVVDFGAWQPDRPAHNNDGAIEALNVLPVEGAFVPFKSLAPVGAAMPVDVRGAGAIYNTEDSISIFAGALNGVYSKQGSAFAQLYVSPLTLDTLQSWQFVRVKNNVIGLHPQVAPVVTNVGGFTAFSPLGGNPPTAACGAYISNFLMLGNFAKDPDDSNNSAPNRVRWGGFNNIAAPWITNSATQSDYQDMPAEGGPVIAISGRETGTIFQARSISRATYQGLPTVFSISTVETKRGPLSRDSVVDLGPYQLFPAEDGFYLWNGTNSKPIGTGRVDRYFRSRLAYAQRQRIVGAVDLTNKCVLWAFPTDASGFLNELIIYSYAEDKWSHSIQTLEYIFSTAVSALVTEDLTNSTESYLISFDSTLFKGGRATLGGFDSLNNYGLFNGPNLAATIDTGEFSAPSDRRLFVAGATPQVDVADASANLQVAMRDQLMGEPLVFTSPAAQEINGFCPLLADARYMRFRLNIPYGARWQHATGVDVMRKPTGIV